MEVLGEDKHYYALEKNWKEEGIFLDELMKTWVKIAMCQLRFKLKTSLVLTYMTFHIMYG
jgi:hypothetical protein